MDHYCANHPERKSFSLCNSCKRHFCSECLTEGGEFYFCNDPACQLELEQDISRRQDFGKEKSRRRNPMKMVIRLPYLLGLGFLYYLAYYLGRLILLPVIKRVPSVVPPELLDGTTAFVATSALETMIVAAGTGIAMSIFIIRMYRNKALIFGSLAIVVYLTLSLTMLLIRYFPGSIEDPVLWTLTRYARPFLVSAVFYFVLICVIKSKGKRLLRRS